MTTITPFYFKKGEPAQQTIFTAPYQSCTYLVVTATIDGASASYGTGQGGNTLEAFENKTGVRLAYETPDDNTLVFASGEYQLDTNIKCTVTAKFQNPGGQEVVYSCESYLYTGTCFVVRYHDMSDNIVREVAEFSSDSDQVDYEVTLLSYSDSWGVPTAMAFSEWTDSRGNPIGIAGGPYNVPADTVVKVYPMFKSTATTKTITVKLQYSTTRVEELTQIVDDTAISVPFSIPAYDPERPTYRLEWSDTPNEVANEPRHREEFGWLSSMDPVVTLYPRYVFLMSTTIIRAVDTEGNPLKDILSYTYRDKDGEFESHEFTLPSLPMEGKVFLNWSQGTTVYNAGATIHDTCHRDTDIFVISLVANYKDQVILRARTYAKAGDTTETFADEAIDDMRATLVYTLPAPPPRSDYSDPVKGWQFTGWVQSDGTTSTNLGTDVTSVTLTATESKTYTFTAQWSRIYEFTIIYDLNDGSGRTVPVKVQQVGETINYELDTDDKGASLVGHTFKGWGTTPTSANTVTQVENVSYTAPRYVYAVWTTEGWFDMGSFTVPVGTTINNYDVFEIPSTRAVGGDSALPFKGIEYTKIPLGVSSPTLGEGDINRMIRVTCHYPVENYHLNADSNDNQYFIATVTYGNSTTTKSYKYYAKANYSDAIQYVAVRYFANNANTTPIVSNIVATYANTVDFTTPTHEEVKNHDSFKADSAKMEVVQWTYNSKTDGKKVSILAGSIITVNKSDCDRIDNFNDGNFTVFVLDVVANWAEEYSFTITYKVDATDGESIAGESEYTETVVGNTFFGAKLMPLLPVKTGYNLEKWVLHYYTISPDGATVERETSTGFRPMEYIPFTYFEREYPDQLVNSYGAEINTTQKTASITVFAKFADKLEGTIQVGDVYIKLGDPCNIVLAYDEGITNSNYLWWIDKTPYVPGTTTINDKTADWETLRELPEDMSLDDLPIPGVNLEEVVIQMTQTAYYSVAYVVGRPSKAGTYHVYLAHTANNTVADTIYDFNIIVYDVDHLDFNVTYRLKYNMNWLGMTEAEMKQFDRLYLGTEERDYQDGKITEEMGNKVVTITTSQPSLTYYFPMEPVFKGHRIIQDPNSGNYAGKSIYGWATFPEYDPDVYELLNPPDTVLCSYPSNYLREIYAQWDYITDLYLEIDNPAPDVPASIDYGLGITSGKRADYLNKVGRYDSQRGRLFSVYDFKLPITGIHADGYRFMGWRYDRIAKVYPELIISDNGTEIFDPTTADELVQKNDESDEDFAIRKECATEFVSDPTVYKGTVPIMLDGWAHVMKGVWFSKIFTVYYDIRVPNAIGGGYISELPSMSNSPMEITLNGNRYTVTMDTTNRRLVQTRISENGDEYLDMDILPFFYNDGNGKKPLFTNLSEGVDEESEDKDKTYFLSIANVSYKDISWSLDPEYELQKDDVTASEMKVKVVNGGAFGFKLNATPPKDAKPFDVNIQFGTLQESFSALSIQNSCSIKLDVPESHLTDIRSFEMTDRNESSDGTVGSKFELVGFMLYQGEVTDWGYTPYKVNNNGNTIAYYVYDGVSPMYPVGSSVEVYPPKADDEERVKFRVYSGDRLIPVWSREITYIGTTKMVYHNCYPWFRDAPFTDGAEEITEYAPADTEWTIDGKRYIGHVFELPRTFADVPTINTVNISAKSYDASVTPATVSDTTLVRTKKTAYYFENWYSDEDYIYGLRPQVRVAVNDVTDPGKNVEHAYLNAWETVPIKLCFYHNGNLVDVQYVDVRDEVAGANGASLRLTDFVPFEVGKSFSGWKCRAGGEPVKSSYFVSALAYNNTDAWPFEADYDAYPGVSEPVEDTRVLHFDATFIFNESCHITRYGENGVIEDDVYIEGIQSLNYRQNSGLSSTPIMTQNSKATITLDIKGVTGIYTIDFIRVHPDNYDDSSSDSRLWSTAKWRSHFIEMADRWQNLSYNNEGDRTGGFTFSYIPPGDIADCIPPIEENVFISSTMSNEYSTRYVKATLTITLASMKPKGYDLTLGGGNFSNTKVLFLRMTVPENSNKDVKFSQDSRYPINCEYVESSVINISVDGEERYFTLTPDVPMNWTFEGGEQVGWTWFGKDEEGNNGTHECNVYNLIPLSKNGGNGVRNIGSDDSPIYVFYANVDFPEYVSILMPEYLNTLSSASFEITESNIAELKRAGISSYDAILVGGGCGGNTANTELKFSNLENKAAKQADAGEVKYVSKRALPDSMKISVGGGGEGAKFHAGIDVDSIGGFLSSGLGAIGNAIGLSNDLSGGYDGPKSGKDTTLKCYANGDMVANETAEGGKLLDVHKAHYTYEEYEMEGDVAMLALGTSRADSSDHRFGYGIGGLSFSNQNPSNVQNTYNYDPIGLFARMEAFRDYSLPLPESVLNTGDFSTILDYYMRAVSYKAWSDQIKSDLDTYGQIKTGLVFESNSGANAGTGGNASSLSVPIHSKLGLYNPNNLCQNYLNNYYEIQSKYNAITYTLNGSKQTVNFGGDNNRMFFLSIGGTCMDGGDDRKLTRKISPVTLSDAQFRAHDPSDYKRDVYVSQPVRTINKAIDGYTIGENTNVSIEGLFGGGGGANAEFESSATFDGISVKGGNGGAGLVIIRWWKT